MITKNADVLVKQMANGFMIMPNYDDVRYRGGGCIDNVSIHVFQTMQGLYDFLRDHFEHRDSEIPND